MSFVLNFTLYFPSCSLCRPCYPKEKPAVRASLESAASLPPSKTKKSKSRNGVDGAKEEKAKRKKSKSEKEDKAAPDKGVNLNDDLDFWLSASNGNDAKEKKVVAKSEVTVGQAALPITDPKKPAKNHKDKKAKKEKKDKIEKREKKEKKSARGDDQSNHLAANSVIAPVPLAWKPLVQDKHLVMVSNRFQITDCHSSHYVMIFIRYSNRNIALLLYLMMNTKC